MASHPAKDDVAFPTKQLTILAICRFSEPIAFNSILAYTYVMAKDLHNGDDKDASFYAGLLVSAYAVAEALTATGWGIISDRYGRKPVVLIGLGGVALSSFFFGLAKQYWVALLARFVGGALNGNVAVMQTMVAEMVKVPEHEPKAFATQPFVWFLGSIIGSAMGGFLAQPAVFYPNVFPADGLFGRYPYLLPNLVAVVVILLAILQGIIFLEETNPPHKATDADANTALEETDETISETTPLRRPFRRRSLVNREQSASRTRSIKESIRTRASFAEESLPLPIEQRFDIRRNSFGTIHSIKLPQDFQPPDVDPPAKTFNFTIIMLSIALVLIAYHQMAFATLLPTYLLDTPSTAANFDWYGGIGYTIHDVGTYMAVNGVLALLIQALIFPIFVDKVGVWYSFLGTVCLYPISYIIMPFLSALPSAVIPVGIYFTLILQNFFGIIAIPCALILLKNATPSSKVLGKVNGLAMAGCCLARTISPPFAGIVYSLGGSAAAWWSLGGVAILAVVQVFWVPRDKADTKAKVEVVPAIGDTDGASEPLLGEGAQP